MRNAERSGYLTEDQQGGRNGRAAQDIVLGKAYTFDTFTYNGLILRVRTAMPEHAMTESFPWSFSWHIQKLAFHTIQEYSSSLSCTT
eukprot:9250747-Ditylum_brightwellii.AAC.1